MNNFQGKFQKKYGEMSETFYARISWKILKFDSMERLWRNHVWSLKKFLKNPCKKNSKNISEKCFQINPKRVFVLESCVKEFLWEFLEKSLGEFSKDLSKKKIWKLPEAFFGNLWRNFSDKYLEELPCWIFKETL